MTLPTERRHLLVALSAALWFFIGSVLFLLPELEKLLRLYLLWVWFVLPALFGAGAISTLLLLCVGAVCRCWRFCIGVVAAPVCMAAMFAGFAAISITAERVRFFVSEPVLLWRVANHPRVAGEPKLVGFDWGERGAAVHNAMDRLVYDESGEIASTGRSIAWRERARALPVWVTDCSTRAVSRFGRHFYLMRMEW